MSLVATRMQSLRTAYPNLFDKNELRNSELGAWNFFKQDSGAANGIFSSDVKAKIKQSFGNSVVIPVLNSKNVTIGNTRSCTIADDENTSALVTLTFATYAFGFTMTPSLYFNNDIGYQADFDRKLMSYCEQLGRDLDTASLAQLSTNKNALSTGLSSFYTFSGGALQVSQAQKTDFFNQLQDILKFMDYKSDKVAVIGSRTLMPLVRQQSNQGIANSTNLQFQFGPYEFFPTNRLSNSGGIQSTLYAVQPGSVAVESRLDPDSLMGHTIGDSANPSKQWGKATLPIVGLEAGTLYTKDCADRTYLGEAGLKASLLEGYSWSFDLCFATAYNSNTATQFQPIIKGEISLT